MPETEPLEPDQLAEQHRHAQACALGWAKQAEAEHDLASRRATYAREKAGSDYLRNSVAEARDDAQLHRGHSYKASRLAEMWARVATALAPPQAPANGQPATYDVHLYTTAAQQALREVATAADRLARPGSSG